MSRRKNNIQSDYTMDDLADSLLSRILACVDQKAQSNDITKGAIVTRVNEDGTVNVKLPADEEGHEFTKISNQSVYELSVGDSVELYLKGGRYSNCWIIAKHGMGRKRVALETQKGNTVVVGGGSSTGGGSGTIPESILKHLVDYNNPHRVTKEQLGLSKVVTTVNGKTGAVVLNAKDVRALPNTTVIPTTTSQLTNNSGYITSAGAPVQTVNGKTGAVQLTATDVGAISAADISQTLGNSSTKVPSEKAVVDAMSAAGYGDMLKAKYANNSTDDTVDKAFSDANGKNIADTYVPKDGGTLNNVNANTLITTGNYLIGEGCTNFPDGSQGSVVQVVGAGGSAYQTTVIYATNTYAHRAYNGTTWTAWKDTNGAVVSATQPQYQNVGSLWFKEIT